MPGQARIGRVVDLGTKRQKATMVFGLKPSQYKVEGTDPAYIELEFADRLSVEVVEPSRGRTVVQLGLGEMQTLRDVRIGDRVLVPDSRYGLHDRDHLNRPAFKRNQLLLQFESRRKNTAGEIDDRQAVRRREGQAKEIARVEAITPRTNRLVDESFRRAPVTVINESEGPVLFLPSAIHDDEGDPIEVYPVHSSVSSLVDAFRVGRFYAAALTGKLEMAPVLIPPGARADVPGPAGNQAITSKVVFTTENKWGRVYDRVRSHYDFTAPFVITIRPEDVHEPVAVLLGEWTLEPDTDYKYVRPPATVATPKGSPFKLQQWAATVTSELTHNELAQAASSLFGDTMYRFLPGEEEAVESFERKGGVTVSATLENPTGQARAVRVELEFTGSDPIASRPFTRATLDFVIGPDTSTVLRLRVDPPEALSGPIEDPPYTLDLRDVALE
jgi:hypothetical protein